MDKKCKEAKQAVINGSFLSSSTVKLVEINLKGFDDYEPFQHRDPDGLGTTGTLSHMIKGSLGSGILAMPLAFKNGGLWVSLIGAVLIGYLCTHCVHLLVFCSQTLSKRVKRPSLGFAETLETAFQTGPRALHKYSKAARETVTASLLVAYYLGDTVYVVFIATNFKEVIDSYFDVDINVRLYILMLAVVLVPVGSIRDLRYLVPLSMVALTFLMFSCGAVLYEAFQDLPPLSSRPFFSSWSRLPMFYATMCFAIEGIGTVLPIENSMRKPQHFLPLCGVLNIAMVWLVLTYSMVGFFGYLRYGEATQGSITLNLGYGFLGELVRILIALNVLLSYPLIFTPCCNSAWSYLGPYIKEGSKTQAYYTMRIIMILGTIGLAAALPDLEPIIGLVGTVCYSTLGILFPAVTELVTFWEHPGYLGPGRWRLYKDGLLMVAWLICLVAGLTTSVQEVIDTYTG